MWNVPITCNPSGTGNQILNNGSINGGGGGKSGLSGETGNPSPEDPRWGNKKGGGKTGRKINPKRAEKWKKEIDNLQKSLKKAKTKAEKIKIKRKLKHARTKLQESEPHAIKGQGY